MSLDSETRFNILWVDGEKADFELMRDALAGYDTVCAFNAFEALRAIDQRAFHAYVIRYGLPDWSGLPLCKTVRRSDPRVPIIVWDQAGSDENRKRALRSGATVYFVEAIKPGDLQRALCVLLIAARSESEDAKREEERVILEELKRRAADVRERTGAARLTAARSIERTARTKALLRYLEAGGTLAHFESAWQPSFSAGWTTTLESEF